MRTAILKIFQCMPYFFVFVFAIAAAMAISGCGDDSECGNNRDCENGEICQNKKCKIVSPADSESESNWESDSSGTETDTETNTGTGNDSDSNVSSDSESSGIAGCLSNTECDDGNPCTADFCNFSTPPPYSCDTEAYTDGANCDDSDPCNGRDSCLAGECTHTSPPCEDLPSASGCGVNVASCSVSADSLCSYALEIAPNNQPCAHLTPCSQGVCTEGVCEDFENPCGTTVDKCTLYSCEVLGEALDEYNCSIWTNETDTECL